MQLCRKPSPSVWSASLTYLGYMVVDLRWCRWVLSKDVVGQCVLPPLVTLISLESLLGGCKHSVSVPSVGIFESNHRHWFFNNLAIAASRCEFSYPGCGFSEAPSSPCGPSCQPPSSIAAAAGCEHLEARAAWHRWCRRCSLSAGSQPPSSIAAAARRSS